MNPYTKETQPGAGGYTPSPPPAQQVKTKRRHRNLGTQFRTSRRVRYLACAAIVVLGALAVPTVSHLMSKPQPLVLEAARTLPAGHVIAQGDLTPITGAQQGASLVPAGQATALLGRELKTEVPAGALLAPGDLGSFPPAGMTLVPVAVKPGQYPPSLDSGQLVAIFPTPTSTSAATSQAAHAAATGRVVQIQAASDSSGTVVVLLETSTAMAPAIAQAPGMVLVCLDAQGDTP